MATVYKLGSISEDAPGQLRRSSAPFLALLGVLVLVFVALFGVLLQRGRRSVPGARQVRRPAAGAFRPASAAARDSSTAAPPPSVPSAAYQSAVVPAAPSPFPEPASGFGSAPGQRFGVPPAQSSPVNSGGQAPAGGYSPGSPPRSGSFTTPGAGVSPAGSPDQLPGEPLPRPARLLRGSAHLAGARASFENDGRGHETCVGRVKVVNDGPYAITDFRLGLRVLGTTYVLVPFEGALSNHYPILSRRIPPGGSLECPVMTTGHYTSYSLHGLKYLTLEASVDGPPGIVTDEASLY